VIDTTSGRSARSAPDSGLGGQVRIEAFPEVASSRPIDVAECLRDLPGLALLESARPGRNSRWSYLAADPVAVLETPAPGGDPFAVARRLVSRLDASRVSSHNGEAPPFVGGLIGYLGYDLGHELERLPVLVADDQQMPILHLGLYDWAIAWDRRTGAAWLGGRAFDGDAWRLDLRLAEVRERIRRQPPGAATLGGPITMEAIDRDDSTELRFSSRLDRAAYEAGVERIRTLIERGDIYQANLTRRLETPFTADPWHLYRRLRTGDPSLFSGYLEVGRPGTTRDDGGRRAILSASPEPFLSVDRSGAVKSDPIKGTRPRGRTRDDDRALACELLASEKDRAENVMIVDVLRNDLGRVCRPGSVRVPRLCRLERTATVQHLVSTVTGRLRSDRDVFHLLGASFPGGSITGAPKIRAMEILEELEPVRRGPYTGMLGWIGPDGTMASSILIRTFVADGRRLTLHVGGGITYRSDPAAEWEETVAKASGPLGAINGSEVAAG
jgi:para-aminobenzoate synthetase component 1